MQAVLGLPEHLRAAIDANVVKVMWDYDGLVSWVDDLTARIGAEALARQNRMIEGRPNREEEV